MSLKMNNYNYNYNHERALNGQSRASFLRLSVIFLVVSFITYLMVQILIDYPKRLNAYNDHVCAVYGKQSDCKTPLTPRQLCENYYNHVCTENGELPDKVVIIK